ncbi:hypothetical protein LIHA111178_13585 [Litorimonas haliclonae]
MALSDFDFLVLGIARDTDNLHPVQKRLRHIQTIGRRDKHCIGQVVVNVQIMIVERVVLFRIQYFKKRRRWIAAMIHSHFIDFIKQK